MENTPHVSIKPEIVFHLYGFPVTNSLITSYAALLVFFCIALYYYLNNESQSRPVFIIRFFLSKLYTTFEGILQDKTDKAFPFLCSFFLIILLSNWMGLLPGVGSLLVDLHGHHVPLLRAATADLNLTIALAVISFTLIQVFGFTYLGLDYLSKFITFKNPIAFFTGILEIISEFSKIISFAFRLFGNIFAGEVLLVVIAFLIPVLASFPFLLLEVFVGFVQALVFSMLTAVFLNVATAQHH